MSNLPQFAAGDLEKIQSAIDVGILTYPSWVYVRDKTMMAFIDKDLSINLIEGNNNSVIFVDKLPNISEAKKDTLYILKDIVYIFDGTEYKSMYKNISIDDFMVEISLEKYNALSDEERKNKLYFIYDDERGGTIPPTIQFERNEDDNGVIIKAINYDGTVSTSVIFDGSIEHIRDEIEDTLGDNAATDEDIDSLFP